LQLARLDGWLALAASQGFRSAELAELRGLVIDPGPLFQEE